MSNLTFTLKGQTDQRIDLSPLVCQKLQNLNPEEIAGIQLQHGNRKVRVDELFNISGSDSQNIVFAKAIANWTILARSWKAATSLSMATPAPTWP